MVCFHPSSLQEWRCTSSSFWDFVLPCDRRVNRSHLSLKKICRDTLFLEVLERSPIRVGHPSSTPYPQIYSNLYYFGHYSYIFILFSTLTTTWSLVDKRRRELDFFFKTLLLILKFCQMAGGIFWKKFHMISIRKQKMRRRLVNHWVFVRGTKRH